MSFELLDCQCGKKRHNVDRIVGGNDAIVSYSYKKHKYFKYLYSYKKCNFLLGKWISLDSSNFCWDKGNNQLWNKAYNSINIYFNRMNTYLQMTSNSFKSLF